MFSPIVIGSAGVGLLLVAFGLNLVRVLKENSATYLTMNLIGALMAAWYAWTSQLIPFVILEGVWAAVSLVRLGTQAFTKKPLSRG